MSHRLRSSRGLTHGVLFTLLCLSIGGAEAQLSKANEPCATDADCLEGWEICKERLTDPTDLSEEVSEYVCVHKD